MFGFKAFILDEQGATAIEYGLIASIMALGIVAVLSNLRSELQGTFSDVATHFQNIDNP